MQSSAPFPDLSLQSVRSHMLHYAFRPFTRFVDLTRHFHPVTTDFIAYNERGHLITQRMPIVIDNPGESYVLIDRGVGNALGAASPCMSSSAAGAGDRCKLEFFHDSQHFGFGQLSLYEKFSIADTDTVVHF